MNFKQIASVGILATGLGFLSLDSVDARNSLSQPSTTISPTSSYKIAQTFRPSPIYETWKLTHSFDGIVYESTLNMNGYFGVMKTRYFHPIRQKTVVVRQNMRLDTTPQGLILYGSNPVDDKTNKSTDYFADNFLISIRPEGRLVLHCDNQGACSHVDFEVIKR